MPGTPAMKEAFCLFDTDRNGKVAGRDIPTLIRSLGVNPTDEQLDSMVGGDKYDTLFTYEDFCKMAESLVSSVDAEAELIKAFKTFDRENNGTISTSELKHVLTNLGERLTAQDVEDLLKLGDPQNSGQLKYAPFVQMLLGKVN